MSAPGLALAAPYRLHPARIRFVREVVEGVEAQRLAAPVDVVRFLCHGLRLHEEAQEVFVALYLDARHRPVHFAEVTRGTLDSSLIHPREVWRPALVHSLCAAVIVAHNHPSGDPTPSPEDRAVTRHLARAGETLGIPLLDHIVVGGPTRWTALGESGDLLNCGAVR